MEYQDITISLFAFVKFGLIMGITWSLLFASVRVK